ncbi:MAG: hypothetical protein ABI334_01330 [Candidatus Dormiibacterota bacterium]
MPARPPARGWGTKHSTFAAPLSLTERILVVELQAWYVALDWPGFRRPSQCTAAVHDEQEAAVA